MRTNFFFLSLIERDETLKVGIKPPSLRTSDYSGPLL